MFNRRGLLNAAAAVGFGALTGMANPAEQHKDAGGGAPGAPAGARIPTLQFVYEADITLADTLNFGPTLEGTRRIIPITGGSFKGPHMSGQVLSLGADWNLSRSDGGSSVEAVYYLRTDDGVTIRIVNKGVGGGARPDAKNTVLIRVFSVV